MKPWQMGTHLIALSKSYPMNTNMTRVKIIFIFFAFSVHQTRATSAAQGGQVQKLNVGTVITVRSSFFISII